MKNIIVQGLGFVGSAMATAIASKLDEKKKPVFQVIGIDKSSDIGLERIDSINFGKFPFPTNDTKLKSELKKSFERGNISATSDTTCYSKADIVLVSINCDLIKDDKNQQEKIAIDNFSNSILEIAKNISEKTLVIIESTVPPGTCQKIVYPIFKETFKKRKLDINKFYLAHSYERVMPGDEYYNSIINYWRVYSGINKKSAKQCELFLSQIINIKDYPLTCLENTTASETGKLIENSYRAVNIAFIEEWGRFAEDVNIDIYDVINAIRMRPTHNNIRQPGFGVGGYCLTKDPLFAKIAARDILNKNGHDFPFSSQAIKINEDMPLVTLRKLKTYFNNNLKNKMILLLGVTYRSNVGDTRFSPSEIFVKEAIKEGAIIEAFDPMVNYWDEMGMKLLSELPDFNIYDVVVFAVSHTEYARINLTKCIKNHGPLLFDANNVLTKEQVLQIKKSKLNYISIGRG